MKCPCGKKLELSQYSRDHQDGEGPKLLFTCPNEECSISRTVVKREHLPGGEKTLEQLRADYFRHVLEVPHETKEEAQR